MELSYMEVYVGTAGEGTTYDNQADNAQPIRLSDRGTDY